MACIYCIGNNSQARNSCSKCGNSAEKGGDPFNGKIIKESQEFLPNLLSRSPGSPLYVIVDPERFEKTNFWGKKIATSEISPHGLDLATINKNDWKDLFLGIFEKSDLVLSSNMAPSLEGMIGNNFGLFHLSPKLCHVEFPDAPDQHGVVFDLSISSIAQLVEVAHDFFARPSELLELHAWVDFNDSPPPAPTNSNAVYIPPAVTTTFIFGEGFDF